MGGRDSYTPSLSPCPLQTRAQSSSPSQMQGVEKGHRPSLCTQQLGTRAQHSFPPACVRRGWDSAVTTARFQHGTRADVGRAAVRAQVPPLGRVRTSPFGLASLSRPFSG